MKEIKYLIPYVIIASFNYYFAKNGVFYASPLVFMGLRYLIAGSILLGISRKFTFNRDILYLSLMTMTSTIFWAFGLLFVSPAESAVLSYSMPLFSLPIAFVLVKEKPTHTELIGIIIGFIGIMIYGFPLIHGFTVIGMILTIVNAFFWGMYTVFYRKLKEEDPVSINGSQFMIGAAIMLILSVFDFKLVINASFAIDLIWLATIGGSIQFLLWNYMIRISQVNRITVLAFSVPIFTMILSAFISRSIPDDISIIGVIVMFSGILISRTRMGIATVKTES